MLEENENCTQAALAEQLNVTPASVATSTKRLQKAGFITKTVDKDNLRCKRLSLTDKGRNTIRQHHEIFNEYDNRIFRNFSEEEKTLFMKLLNRLLDEMKAVEGNGSLPDDPVKLTMTLHQNMKEFATPHGDDSVCSEHENK
jgi:DNA-binding MarR family transcriptional regulator